MPALTRDMRTRAVRLLLLAALFGNSPFLTGIAVREWAFLTRLVEEGADTAFDSVIAETAQAPTGETQSELMRRLRICRRRVALAVNAAIGLSGK